MSSCPTAELREPSAATVTALCDAMDVLEKDDKGHGPKGSFVAMRILACLYVDNIPYFTILARNLNSVDPHNCPFNPESSMRLTTAINSMMVLFKEPVVVDPAMPPVTQRDYLSRMMAELYESINVVDLEEIQEALRETIWPIKESLKNSVSQPTIAGS
jgi:hypothetical protein